MPRAAALLLSQRWWTHRETPSHGRVLGAASPAGRSLPQPGRMASSRFEVKTRFRSLLGTKATLPGPCQPPECNAKSRRETCTPIASIPQSMPCCTRALIFQPKSETELECLHSQGPAWPPLSPVSLRLPDQPHPEGGHECGSLALLLLGLTSFPLPVPRY